MLELVSVRAEPDEKRRQLSRAVAEMDAMRLHARAFPDYEKKIMHKRCPKCRAGRDERCRSSITGGGSRDLHMERFSRPVAFLIQSLTASMGHGITRKRKSRGAS